MPKKKKGSYHNAQDKRLTDAIKSELQKAMFQGMAVGAKTYCQMFLDKINMLDKSSTEEDKDAVLDDIKHFCEVGLGTKKGSIN